jgi:hypothetical protein
VSAILTDARLQLRADLRGLWSGEATGHSEVKVPAKMTLLYRGTRDGFDNDVFHKLCNGKGATLVLIKGARDGVFGGFTSVPWHSGGLFSADAQAFLFALRGPHAQAGQPLKLVPTTRPEQAVFSHVHSSWGVVFGTGSGPAYDLAQACHRRADVLLLFGRGEGIQLGKRARNEAAHATSDVTRDHAGAPAVSGYPRIRQAPGYGDGQNLPLDGSVWEGLSADTSHSLVEMEVFGVAF